MKLLRMYCVIACTLLLVSMSTTAFALSVNTNDIVDGAVTTPKLSDGAVTNAKIGGMISASKLEKPGKVTVVAQSGGDYTDPLTAMNSLSTWCGSPSPVNPCLIKIMPGVYPEPSQITLPDYVDIEGSGQATTKISRSAGPGGPALSIACTHCEVRDLTLENIGNQTYEAVTVHAYADGKLTNVDIVASGFTDNSISLYDAGLELRTADGNNGPILTNVNIYTDGVGISDTNPNGTSRYNNIRILPTGATLLYALYCPNSYTSSMVIRNSELFGSILNRGTASYNIVNSQIAGSLTGSFKILNCYDANYNPIPNQ